MAKQGMKRPLQTQTKPKNAVAPVPSIQGKAKSGKQKARDIIAGASAPDMKVYHHTPVKEKPISNVYSTIDNDLARDNLENDIPAADLQDL